MLMSMSISNSMSVSMFGLWALKAAPPRPARRRRRQHRLHNLSVKAQRSKSFTPLSSHAPCAGAADGKASNDVLYAAAGGKHAKTEISVNNAGGWPCPASEQGPLSAPA
jgi:hypothetical protein